MWAGREPAHFPLNFTYSGARSVALMPSLLPRRWILSAIFVTLLLPAAASFAQAPAQKNDKPGWFDRFLGIKPDRSGGWLFAGFKNDGKDGIHFAISKDGYHWRVVNFDRPIIQPAKKDELMRDPFIQ